MRRQALRHATDAVGAPEARAERPAESLAGRRPRFERLDALRALAILWMAGFHFAFDLAHFKVIQQHFYRDPFWTWQRACIVSLLLFCAGLGQAVAFAQR